MHAYRGQKSSHTHDIKNVKVWQLIMVLSNVVLCISTCVDSQEIVKMKYIVYRLLYVTVVCYCCMSYVINMFTHVLSFSHSTLMLYVIMSWSYEYAMQSVIKVHTLDAKKLAVRTWNCDADHTSWSQNTLQAFL